MSFVSNFPSYRPCFKLSGAFLKCEKNYLWRPDAKIRKLRNIRSEYNLFEYEMSMINKKPNLMIICIMRIPSVSMKFDQ
jgi:hypothetical protein